MQTIALEAWISGSRLARDRGCRAGGQKLPSEIVATVEQFEPQARTAQICRSLLPVINKFYLLCVIFSGSPDLTLKTCLVCSRSPVFYLPAGASFWWYTTRSPSDRKEPRVVTYIKRLPGTKLQWKWVAYKCPLNGFQAMKCEYGLLSKKTEATEQKNKLCVTYSSHRAVMTSS